MFFSIVLVPDEQTRPEISGTKDLSVIELMYSNMVMSIKYSGRLPNTLRLEDLSTFTENLEQWSSDN